MFADPVSADVATLETTTSTTYTDLPTSGPAVTLSLVSGQSCRVTIRARSYHSAGGSQGAAFSFAVSGASTLAASDANGTENDGTVGLTLMADTVFTATSTGSHTFTMKYRVVAGGTGSFVNRRIVVKKF